MLLKRPYQYPVFPDVLNDLGLRLLSDRGLEVEAVDKLAQDVGTEIVKLLAQRHN